MAPNRVLALIPARAGSKGIPGKNLRTLGGKTLIHHAVECAIASGCSDVIVTTDLDFSLAPYFGRGLRQLGYVGRPPGLASDSAAMGDVVKHALEYEAFAGKEKAAEIVVLLQPTQPFRKPEHVQQALALLRESGADSVVSVVPLPLTHSPAFLLYIDEVSGELLPCSGDYGLRVADAPSCRQDAAPAYIRDGTVYAFWRKTVEQHGNIYGQDVRPLIIDPADSCELDTEADWAAVERRWKERHNG